MKINYFIKLFTISFLNEIDIDILDDKGPLGADGRIRFRAKNNCIKQRLLMNKKVMAT
jgi:hypothetical protein